ncbi:MAG: prolipoprotein diacylglyceryl transferase family protein [Bacteroidota bacterium]
MGKDISWYGILLVFTIVLVVVFFQNYKKGSTYSNFSFFERNTVIFLFLLTGYLGSVSFGIFERYLIKLTRGYQLEVSLGNFAQDVANSSTGRWFGSIFLYAFGILLYALWDRKRRYIQILDLTLITICLGVIFGKIGCFLDGHYGCYGIPTELPWGVTFPYGTGATLLPVHPVQIYDAIFHSLLFIILLRMQTKSSIAGMAGITFLFSTSFYNILIEFIRTNKVIFGGLTFAQLTYIVVILITLALFLMIRRPSTA